MRLLQDKKVAVVLALIVMIVGSIAYLVMNTADVKAGMDSGNEPLIISTPINSEPTQDNAVEGIPIVNNEALV